MRVTWALISTLCSIGCAGTGPTVHSDGTIPAACAGCVSPPPLEALAADASPKVRRLRTFHDQREDKRHPYLGMAATLEGIRDLIPKASSAVERLRLEHLLTHALLCEGSAEEGVGVLERWRLALPDLAVSPDTEMRFWYGLGMAHFRLAERQNCVAGHNEDSCLFPLEGGGVHTQGEEALAAVRAFELALELDPRFDEARWLANVAQMALGAYPDQTPDRYRLPPTHVESETDLPRFKDRAAALGVARHDRAGGAVLEDIDGNGLLDVLTSSFDPGHRLALYFQRAPEVFEDGSTSPGLEDQLGGVDLLCRDFDDDGLLDILVLRGGHLGEIGQLPDSLLQQVQPGVFRDVTAEAGFEIDAPTRTASAADIDLDGDLDLFLGYETILRGPSGARFPHRLLRNDGGMRFTDITDGSGIATAPTCAGASFGDIDGDRYPDLFVSHSSARNRLYHNRGDGTFTDVTADAGVAEPLESSVTWFFDYDNDGDLDLFVAHYAQSDRGAAIARYYFESVVPRSTMRLYDNRGNGRFDDVTAARGLARVCFPIGGNFGDLDGNGFPDIYLATGAPEMDALWPNVALVNHDGQAFRDATKAAGLGHLQKGNGVAFGDIDRDGDQDVLVQVGGVHLDDGFANVLFDNPGHGHHWLTVDLRGSDSNRFGIGSRIRLRVEGPQGERDLFAFVGSTSSLGGNSLQEEFALGDATRIIELEVFWPKTAATQRFPDVPLDTRVRVREDRASLEVVDGSR